MDKKARKSALSRKMDQSYQPDPSEQEKNYDATNGMYGSDGGDSGTVGPYPHDGEMGGSDASSEQSPQDGAGRMEDLANSVQEIMGSKTVDDKTKGVVSQLMDILASVMGGQEGGQASAPSKVTAEDGQLSSAASGKPVMNMGM